MRFILFISAICISLVSCDSNDLDADSDLQCIQAPVYGTLQPVEVGNQWEYELLISDAVVANNYRYAVTDRLSDHTGGRTDLFVISQFVTSDPLKISKSIWTNSSQGYHNVGRISGQDTTMADFITYPFPSNVGETFSSYRLDTASPNESPVLVPNHDYEVIEQNHETSVPLGVFGTIVFEEKHYFEPGADYGNGPVFHQFAPGIGLVARDRLFLATEDGPLPGRMQLVDYCLMQ